VRFVVDDVEMPWRHPEKFDFIHVRMMFGALEDWARFLQNCFECVISPYSFLVSLCLCRCFRNMRPEGWVEVSGPHLPFGCDDNSLPPKSPINNWSSLMLEASVTLKRPMNIGPELREMMRDAGFINIVEKVYKWPINSWSEDQWEKKLGLYTNLDLEAGVEGFSMKFFTAGLGWSPLGVTVLSAQVKAELKRTEIHAYLKM